jgi:hypothetical protein
MHKDLKVIVQIPQLPNFKPSLGVKDFIQSAMKIWCKIAKSSVRAMEFPFILFSFAHDSISDCSLHAIICVPS